MIKKIVVCALVLGVVLNCVGCSLFESPEEELVPDITGTEASVSETESATAELTETDVVPETVPAEYALMLPAEEQIALFVANRELWYPVEDFYVPYSYAVTDLDQNGRLELLVNVCMGTGFFSQNTAWEVNETGDGIVDCGDIFRTDGSQIDLGVSIATVYLDAEGGYHYIISDYIRDGGAYNITVDYAMELKGGQLSLQHLASVACNAYDDGTMTFTYTSSNGEEISQEEYEGMADAVFTDGKKMLANFGWQSKTMEEAELLDADGWHRLLEQSWAEFSLN